MKKILLIAVAIFMVYCVSSCTKDNSVKPAAVHEESGTLGTADGSPPQ